MPACGLVRGLFLVEFPTPVTPIVGTALSLPLGTWKAPKLTGVDIKGVSEFGVPGREIQMPSTSIPF